MDKKALSLEEIHIETLNVIKKIEDICEIIDVKYFITYGTLIGAVRHKGFIPWDDDFDIMMLRPDYDKFVAYCEKHAEELFPYRIATYNNTYRYTFAIARFCDTSYEMEMFNGNEVEMGLFIDIYPLDGLGKGISDFSRKVTLIKLKWLRQGIYYSYKENVVQDSNNALKEFCKTVFCKYAQRKGKDYFINKLEKKSRKHSVEESDFVACITWTIMQPIKKEYTTELIDMEYENVTVKAPKYYDELLTMWYGDYMMLPPEDMQKPQHDYFLYKKTKY